MLRAIAGYFFGGAEEEAPQTVIECDTREVNDWLVVNMTDRPDDGIDMEDEIQVELMTDNEYDEILDAVSCLMRTDELDNAESFLDEECSETEEIDSQTWSKSDENSSDESDDDDRMSVSSDSDSIQLDTEREVTRRFVPMLDYEPFFFFNLPGAPKSINLSDEVVQNFRIDDRTCFLARSKPATVVANQNSNFKYPSGTDGLHDYKKAVKVVRPSDCLPVQQALVSVGNFDTSKYVKISYSKIKQMVEMVKENQRKTTRCPEVTCHPMYSKSYVNHRNPALQHKTDVMQKIKQLEVEQAQDNKIKKFISKGQLNRQNKNYIFETSCKKNRRKNLQRNPSGANNNRKC